MYFKIKILLLKRHDIFLSMVCQHLAPELTFPAINFHSSRDSYMCMTISTNQRAVSCNYIKRCQFDKSALSLCYLLQQQIFLKKSLHTYFACSMALCVSKLYSYFN